MVWSYILRYAHWIDWIFFVVIICIPSLKHQANIWDNFQLIRTFKITKLKHRISLSIQLNGLLTVQLTCLNELIKIFAIKYKSASRISIVCILSRVFDSSIISTSWELERQWNIYFSFAHFWIIVISTMMMMMMMMVLLLRSICSTIILLWICVCLHLFLKISWR